MSPPRVGVGEILDEASELVSVASPWMGLLWLTSAPLRLSQAHFAARLIELGPEARQYGDHLRGLAAGVAAAFLLSLWGRAVFASACGSRLQGLGEPGRGALRLPLRPLLSYVYAALLIEVAFYATCMSGVSVPFLALLAGLAAAGFREVERPGLLAPFARIARQGPRALPLVGIVLVFTAAFVLAAVNLYFVFQLGLWLAGGVAGADTTRWTALLAYTNPRFLCVLLAGGWLVVEPYWLAALVVYVHKLRSRTTGEDLRVWFERLRGAAVLAAGLALAAPLGAQEQALSVPAYADALRGIAERLETGRLEEARTAARELAPLEVDWASERLATDSTVLEGVAAAKTTDARVQAMRIRRLIAALGAAPETPAAATEADPEDLARLVPRDEPGKGGQVGPIPLEPLSVPERITESLLAGYDWVAKQIRGIADWLDRFRPRRARDGSDPGGTAAAAVFVVAAATLLLALLAFRTLRRAREAGMEVQSGHVSSAKDDDPLSRQTAEWETYARELAAAGRWREAVRAWYHAVLVGLFRARLVHYQKGRTNWEYAARLPPDLAWRPAFLDLTRLFDREWYGHRSSHAEAARECAEAAQTILQAVRGAGEAA